MAVNIYTATVKYPASPEPFDSGWGPSHNVRLVFDDPSAPKSDGSGETNVYKKAGTRDVDYMLTLREGDHVQLVWTERDGKGWYDFIIPSDFDLSPTHTSEEAPPAVTRGPIAIEWASPDDTYWEIWSRALAMERRKIDMAILCAVDMLGDDSTFEHDDIMRVGIEIYRRASAHAKPGLVLPNDNYVADVDKDASLLLMIDSDDMVNSLLNAILELSGGFYSAIGLKNTLKELGLSSTDVKDQDSCLLLAHVAWDYADMINAGADESVALNATAEKHGLAAF